MKKRYLVRYGSIGEVIEIKITDYSGRPIEQFKFNGRDKETYGLVLDTLEKKYGFKPLIKFEETVPHKEEKKEDKGFFDY